MRFIFEIQDWVFLIIASLLVLRGVTLLKNPKLIISICKTFTDKEKSENLIYYLIGIYLITLLIVSWKENHWDSFLFVILLGCILITKTLFWIHPAGASLILGLIIFLVHYEFFSVFTKLFTIFGGFLILKAILWICFPNRIINFTKKIDGFVENKRFIWFSYSYALLLIALGLFLLYVILFMPLLRYLKKYCTYSDHHPICSIWYLFL